MLLAGVLFGLVTVGFVVPCLVDVAVTPAAEVRSLTKSAWAAAIVFGSVFGAVAWLTAGRPDRRRRTPLPRHLEGAPSFSPQEALRRHPAGRAMDPVTEASPGPAALRAGGAGHGPVGPDDDPEFLQELARRIRHLRGPGSNA
jgi:Phospholipase_D-nuclease N-terminal